MTLTHMVMFRFFAGASTPEVAPGNPGIYSKIHQGPGFAF